MVYLSHTIPSRSRSWNVLKFGRGIRTESKGHLASRPGAGVSSATPAGYSSALVVLSCEDWVVYPPFLDSGSYEVHQPADALDFRPKF